MREFLWFTKIISIVQLKRMSLRLRCIDDTRHSKSILDEIYVHQQSWPVHWWESYTVDMLHQIVVNNHLYRIIIHPFQSTNGTADHHTLNIESNHYANFDQVPKSLDHLDHSNSLRIGSLVLLHREEILSTIVLIYDYDHVQKSVPTPLFDPNSDHH